MKNYRKHEEQPIKDVIKEMWASYHLDNKINDTKVVACWEKLMGKGIAAHTKYLYVRKGTLFLHLDSAPLRNELFFAKEKLIKLLNNELGQEHIKEVVIR